MRRLVRGDRRYHEQLFATVRSRSRTWTKAAYPPGCRPERGPVLFTAAPDGSLVVHVRRGALPADDFRLRMLFATGVGVFATPRDLLEFSHGPLADSFGMTAPDDEWCERGPEPDVARPREPVPDGHVQVPGTGTRPFRPAGTAEGPAETDDGETPAVGAAVAAEGAAAPAATVVSGREIAERLSRVVVGQDAALERVGHAVSAQLAKRLPRRPGVLLLLGPTGTGKTLTVESLPGALQSLGRRGAFVFRVDCTELTQGFQVARLLGAPPGYVGHDTPPQLLDALARPGCILLLDEVDRAHPSVVEDVLLNLLDRGRLSTPGGRTVDAAHAVIALTTSLGADDLATRLHRVAPDNRWAVQAACREHLAVEGVPDDLVGRIGTFAVYEALGRDALERAAVVAIKLLAREYRLRLPALEPVIADVVVDVAGATGLGARALDHAAAQLLAPVFTDAVRDGLSGPVAIDPGPPLHVHACTGRATGRSRQQRDHAG